MKNLQNIIIRPSNLVPKIANEEYASVVKCLFFSLACINAPALVHVLHPAKRL